MAPQAGKKKNGSVRHSKEKQLQVINGFPHWLRWRNPEEKEPVERVFHCKLEHQGLPRSADGSRTTAVVKFSIDEDMAVHAQPLRYTVGAGAPDDTLERITITEVTEHAQMLLFHSQYDPRRWEHWPSCFNVSRDAMMMARYDFHYAYAAGNLEWATKIAQRVALTILGLGHKGAPPEGFWEINELTGEAQRPSLSRMPHIWPQSCYIIQTCDSGEQDYPSGIQERLEKLLLQRDNLYSVLGKEVARIYDENLRAYGRGLAESGFENVSPIIENFIAARSSEVEDQTATSAQDSKSPDASTQKPPDPGDIAFVAFFPITWEMQNKYDAFIREIGKVSNRSHDGEQSSAARNKNQRRNKRRRQSKWKKKNQQSHDDQDNGASYDTAEKDVELAEARLCAVPAINDTVAEDTEPQDSSQNVMMEDLNKASTDDSTISDDSFLPLPRSTPSNTTCDGSELDVIEKRLTSIPNDTDDTEITTAEPSLTLEASGLSALEPSCTKSDASDQTITRLMSASAICDSYKGGHECILESESAPEFMPSTPDAIASDATGATEDDPGPASFGEQPAEDDRDVMCANMLRLKGGAVSANERWVRIVWRGLAEAQRGARVLAGMFGEEYLERGILLYSTPEGWELASGL